MLITSAPTRKTPNKKNVGKHGSFLEVDIIILGERSQVCQKYPK